MRTTVSDADDPAATKRARWARNSARLHRRRALGDCSDGHPDFLVVLACVWLRGLAPAPVKQDGGGCSAWPPCAVAHDGGKGAHGLVCIRPAQRPDVRWYSLCWQRFTGWVPPSCWRGHQACVRRGDNHANNMAKGGSGTRASSGCMHRQDSPATVCLPAAMNLDGTVLVADRPLHAAVTEHCPCRAHCGPVSRDWARLR